MSPEAVAVAINALTAEVDHALGFETECETQHERAMQLGQVTLTTLQEATAHRERAQEALEWLQGLQGPQEGAEEPQEPRSPNSMGAAIGDMVEVRP